MSMLRGEMSALAASAAAVPAACPVTKHGQMRRKVSTESGAPRQPRIVDLHAAEGRPFQPRAIGINHMAQKDCPKTGKHGQSIHPAHTVNP